MLQPTRAQVLLAAMAAPDPYAWCGENRDRIDKELLRTVRQRLAKAQPSDLAQAQALGDLLSAASVLLDDSAYLELFDRLGRDPGLARLELRTGAFVHFQSTFD